MECQDMQQQIWSNIAAQLPTLFFFLTLSVRPHCCAHFVRRRHSREEQTDMKLLSNLRSSVLAKPVIWLIASF